MKLNGILLLFFWSSILMVPAQSTHFYLGSKMDGDLILEDGSTTHSWGFGNYVSTGNTRISVPAPVLEIPENDTVYIHFYNQSPEDHTIHLHGLDVDQVNDGVPSTSFAIDQNDSITYSFLASKTGTFLYHCHVMTTLHLNMGMYGMIVVTPKEINKLFAGGPSFNKEYRLLNSELDRSWNDSPATPGPFNLFEADYFMVNGLSGTLITGDSLNHISGIVNDSILLRIATVTYGHVDWVFPDELNARVYMSDGRPLPAAINKDTLRLFSGERYSVLLTPEQSFSGQIEVIYHDAVNSNQAGMNVIPVEIGSILPGVENNSNEIKWKLFPNPCSNFLFLSDLEMDATYTIVNSNGVILDYIHGVSSLKFDIQKYPAGNYLVIGPASSMSFIKL